MNCPRCETASLTELDRAGISIDRCDGCRGIWLDRGELEKLIARESRAEDRGDERSDDRRDGAVGLAGEPPRRYRRADSDHDDDDDDRKRGHGKRRSGWWDIFD